jgi:hypothetical protein
MSVFVGILGSMAVDYLSTKENQQQIVNLIGETFDWLIKDNGSSRTQSNDEKGLFYIEYCKYISSILGHAAIADGHVSKQEDLAATEIIDTCFLIKGGLLSSAFLKRQGYTKDDIWNYVSKYFNKPLSIKTIAKYARKLDSLPEFYGLACCIVITDNKIHPNERLFLDNLSNEFKLDQPTKKRMEKEYFTPQKPLIKASKKNN